MNRILKRLLLDQNLLSFQPNIVVSMNNHHNSSKTASGLEQQNPASVQENKYSEEELSCSSKCFDVEDCIIEWFPENILKTKKT